MKKIMKILITSSFIIGVITLIILIGIIRCKLDKLNKPSVTYEDGFDRRLPESDAHSIFLTAVKSDTRIFEVNDVTLDFYMGHKKMDLSNIDFDYDQFKFISVATYFYVEEEVFNKKITTFDDYKNIVGFHLIKEYSLNEFFIEEKKVNIERNKFKIFSEKINFNYYETITIPSYLFDYCENDEKIIYLGIFIVFQDNITGEYFFDIKPFGDYYNFYLKLVFNKTNDNKIVL